MIRAPLRVAWLATWRLKLLLASVLIVTVVPMALLLNVLAGFALGLPLIAFVVLFPCSVFVHEWAHALCACLWSSATGRGDVRPVGGWLIAIVRRPVLPLQLDLATTVAGPVAGTASSGAIWVVSAVSRTPPFESVFLMILFTVHLLALAPIAPDGRAFLAAVTSHENIAKGSA